MKCVEKEGRRGMIVTREVSGQHGPMLEVEVYSSDALILRDSEDRRLMSTIRIGVTADKLRIEVRHPSREAGFGDAPSIFEGRHVQRYVLAERAVRNSGAVLVDVAEANDQVNSFLDQHLGSLKSREPVRAVC